MASEIVKSDYVAVPATGPGGDGLKVDVRRIGLDPLPEDTACPDYIARVLNAIEPEFGEGRTRLVPASEEVWPPAGMTDSEVTEMVGKSHGTWQERRESFVFFGVPRSLPHTALETDAGLAEQLWSLSGDGSRSSYPHSFA